ncbi:hypothetical protein KAJ83_16155 [Marivibrio halodurans]|uniref:Thiolase C-terminal domain-containing protein n=1 Tax=Marivibrio halodurans TaxID=2039722 RepID=A0A8J7V279_9PROT|nr:hypothetical protein [Marivibrio halodurans]MBP5858556.1 hypothetical protein [Marivibrio halodurans]
MGGATTLIPNSTGKSLEELLYDVAQKAVASAGITYDDIDGIVVAANDQYDGRAISVMAASGPVGGVDRDILCTPSAGEHAFVTGALRVASKLFDTQLVLAWSPAEVSSFSEAQRLAADPYYHRRLPLDELSSHALQASALGASVENLADLSHSVLTKNRANGAVAYPDIAAYSSGVPRGDHPVRWPIFSDMIAPPITGLVAMVLAGEDFVADRGLARPVWIEGMGWATEPSFLGDRNLGGLPSLEAAAAQAFAEAGVSDPVGEFDVAELADATPHQELLSYEGLSLCRRDGWEAALGDGTFHADGRLPVNLSGGALSVNPIFCTGLMRISEVARQLRGEAGAAQKEGAARGVAHAASGIAMQYNTVIVMNNQQPGTVQ